MGQYYKAYVENKDGKFVLDSWDYGSGMKLMEHSWLGNDFENAAYTLIDKRPSKVGWIGDYSQDVGCDKDLYRFVWSSDENNRSIVLRRKYKDGYLINHTKKEYVDLEEYTDLARNKSGWVTNPLSLLTAIGNGLGGGDYHDCNQNYNLVGIWYMDELEYDGTEHPDYANITADVIFKEDW